MLRFPPKCFVFDLECFVFEFRGASGFVFDTTVAKWPFTSVLVGKFFAL